MIYVSATVTAFLAAFAAEAGKDAYASLKQFVRDVKAARRGRDGSIVVQDRENREDSTVLALSADLPEEAFAALEDLDLEAVKGAYLVWDRDGGKGWARPDELAIATCCNLVAIFRRPADRSAYRIL